MLGRPVRVRHERLQPEAWDIHDDQAATEGHTATSICGGLAAIDAVDNCLGGDEIGRSRGRSTARILPGTSGPFDPARPGSSYLPDGKLDAGDAPMPAARIDVDLTGNVGALVAADKHVLYSRNRTGAASALFRTTRTTCTRRSTCRCFPATSPRPRSWATHVRDHGTDREQLPGLPVRVRDVLGCQDVPLLGSPRRHTAALARTRAVTWVAPVRSRPSAGSSSGRRDRLGDGLHRRAWRGDPAVRPGRRRCADAERQWPLRSR